MWLKIDDGFHSHPKVVRAGNAAVGLWVRCASFSTHYLTDGHVPADVAASYAGRPAELTRLTDTGLWIPNGTGYEIKGYLEHNPSSVEWRSYLDERAEAGRRGGRARAAKARRNEHGQFANENGDPW